MRVVGARLFGFCVPMRDAVQTSQGLVAEREGLLISIESASGHEGWGEASPFPGFGLESIDDSRRCLEGLIRDCVANGEPLSSSSSTVSSNRAFHAPVARSAFETAVADLTARELGCSLADHLATCGDAAVEAARDVPVNALLSGATPESLSEAGREARDQGYRSFKVKLGAVDVAADVERVAALRSVLGPDARIRLDANQAWSFEVAEQAIRRLAPLDIEFLEQPIAADDLVGLARLRARSAILLAADEAAGSEAAVRDVLAAEAADLIVIKPSAVGGPLAAARIAHAARNRGVEIVVTSLLDAAIGRVAALHFAAYWRGVEPGLRDCGLATGDYLLVDIASAPTPNKGRIALPEGPGLAIAPTLERLDAVKAELLAEERAR